MGKLASRLSVAALILSLDGCAGFVNGFAQGMATPVAAPASSANGFPTSPALLLYGGSDHQTFLGCLNCSQFDASSVWNQYGTYGNKYNTNSVFNPYGQFGSKYTNTGACNLYATDPPVIVDGAGNYYGRLTVNSYAGPIRNAAIIAWLTGLCAGR